VQIRAIRVKSALNSVKKNTLSDRRVQLGLGGALLLLVVVAVYWPALHGQFVWDDALLVDKNPLVTGKLSLLTVWFRTDFPLTIVAFWLEWLAWGNHPVPYHVVNVLLHALGTILVWRVPARLKIPGAWFAALLFAVHPVCVESVAWISEMKNTLSLPFFLASIWCYLGFEEERGKERGEGKGEREEGGGRKSDIARRKAGRSSLFSLPSSIFYLLSLALFLLALLSKTSTVMLPVVLLLCAWWQRGRVTRRDVWRTSPFFALALVFGLMSVWYQKVITLEPVQAENFWGRLAGAGRTVWFYLGKVVWPVNLSMIYPRWTIDPAAPRAWVPLLLLGCVLLLCWWFRRRWGRAALFGLGYFVITLFPAMGFFDMYYLALSRVADHFVYLPLIGIVALAAAGLSALGARFFALERRMPRLQSVPPDWASAFARAACVGVAAALIVAFSLLTMQRARVLARDELLWRDTLVKNPSSWTAYNNLGCLLAAQNKYGEAIKEFESSLQFNADNAQAHCNLGRALAATGRPAAAESQFKRALALRPQNAGIQESFGAFLAAQGKVDEAISHLRESVKLEPDVPTRLELAGLLHGVGDDRGAATQFRDVLAAKPDSQEALNNLAWLLATCSDATVRNGPEAVRLAERACRLTQFKDIRSLGTLAAAYAEAGRFGEAVATAQQALERATATGQEQMAALCRQLLELYRAGKSWHEPQTRRNVQ
jgi:tetratricopeptide (TPR) repeat protein